MSGARLVIDARLQNDDAANALRRLLAKGGNLYPAMDEIGAMLSSSVQHRFETGVAPDGSRWRPSYRAQSEGGQTLVKSARLRQSVTHRAGPDRVEVGTNVIYAGIHQFGGRIAASKAKALRFKVGGRWVTKKSVDIPARPFLGLDRGDEREVVNIVADYLKGAALR